METEGTTTTQDMVKRIREHFPSLHVQSARRIPSSWNNIVLEVNNRLIFRFPRFKLAEKTLQREIKLLPLLQDHLSTPIPNFAYLAQAGKNQYRFAGYEKIPGTPVTATGYRASWTRKLSESFARFLQELHTIRTTGKVARIAHTNWTSQRILRYHNRLRASRHKYLDRKTREMLGSFFYKSIQLLEKPNYESVLIHSDLTDRNLLVNPDNGMLTGIIDWGDARIADPALDFCGLFEVNRHLGYETVRLYGDTSQDFLERIDVYWRTLPYFEILYDMHEGHNEIRDLGLKRIRARLEEPGLYLDDSRRTRNR